MSDKTTMLIRIAYVVIFRSVYNLDSLFCRRPGGARGKAHPRRLM